MNAFELYRHLQAENEKNSKEMDRIEHEILEPLECPKCHANHNIHLEFFGKYNVINCWNCRLSTGECATIEEALEQWDKLFRVLYKPDEEPIEQKIDPESP